MSKNGPRLVSVPPGPCRGFIAQHAILDHSCLPNTFICSHTAMATGWPLMLLLTHGDQETGQWRNAGPGPINTKGSPHSCSYGLKSQYLWLHFLPVFSVAYPSQISAYFRPVNPPVSAHAPQFPPQSDMRFPQCIRRVITGRNMVEKTGRKWVESDDGTGVD